MVETGSHTRESSVEKGHRSLTLGLVAAPEIPEKLANELAPELPELLREHIDDHVSWEVEVVRDPLTGSDQEAPEILDETHDRSRQEGWEYAICLTDLPVHRGRQVVVADASARRGVGGISLPPLGVTLLRRRVREAALQLVSELYHGTSESDRTDEERRRERGTSDDDSRLRGGGARQLMGHRLTERLAPIKRITPEDENMDVDVRFVAPRVRGRMRLLSGMVLANRPWKIFPAFKGAVAAAFATGTYGLIFPTLWRLGDAFGLARLVALMVVAIVGMIVWIILSHDLWERSSSPGSRYLAALYNSATALTISVAVLFAYAILFALFLLASLIFVPGSLLQASLGHSAGPLVYAAIAWVTASVATIAGALGGSLDDTDRVREAAFGYRQRRRAEERQEPEKPSTTSRTR